MFVIQPKSMVIIGRILLRATASLLSTTHTTGIPSGKNWGVIRCSSVRLGFQCGSWLIFLAFIFTRII